MKKVKLDCRFRAFYKDFIKLDFLWIDSKSIYKTNNSCTDDIFQKINASSKINVGNIRKLFVFKHNFPRLKLSPDCSFTINVVELKQNKAFMLLKISVFTTNISPEFLGCPSLVFTFSPISHFLPQKSHNFEQCPLTNVDSN